MTPALKDELIRAAVDEMGLNRLRLEPPGGNSADDHRWEWTNDNGDPDVIDWSALNTASLDRRMTEVVLPFKQRVQADGTPFNIYVSPSFFNGGSSGEVPPWLFNSPGEYAEFATSLLLHLKNAHGLTVDYYCILNEAGNNNSFWETTVATMIKTLGPRLNALGLTTRIQFPEAISADTSWGFIRALQGDAAIWPYIGLLSYHLYGNNVPKVKIRDFGLARGIPTAQTEYMNLTMDILYDDLTNGGVSIWEVYGLTSQFEVNYSRLRRTAQFWGFRQVTRYVRPGAVRIGAASSDANVRVLAFKKGAVLTIVLINATDDRSTTVAGLNPGLYSVSQTAGGAPYAEKGLHTADGAGLLTVNLASNSVTTLHSYGGVNLAPVPTTWQAEPEFLTAPASSVTLSVTATDPELDPTSYAWAITGQPAGAAVILATPGAASTMASGLIPGEYVFTVTVGDGVNAATREVRVPVFAANRPPVPLDVHNRNPVVVTLPQSGTTLRAAGWDLEKDPLSYQWEVLSQPPGAVAALASPNAGSCAVSNMSIAGDYVFRIKVSDGHQTVPKTLTVRVYPLNNAPVVQSITVTPPILALPTSGVAQLSASTSDPDGDTITHWWSVVSKPSGTTISIATPGSPATQVSGLTAKGTYTFRLTVIDRSLVTTADAAVVVRSQPGDFDADRDVDQDDYGRFQACLGDPLVPGVPAGCLAGDMNGSGLVDQVDSLLFEQCRSGAGRPADPGCS